MSYFLLQNIKLFIRIINFLIPKTLATSHFHKPKNPINVDFNVLPEIGISAEDFDVLDVIIKVE